MIRATLVYLFVGTYIAVMSPIALAWTLLAKDTTLVYRLGRFCIRVAGWMSRIRVEVHGLERLIVGQPYLFLSNHRGNIDAPVLYYAIPRDMRALIKKEMMHIPILSLVLKQVQFVPIDRRDPQRARAGIDFGAGLLKRGFSFLAFPEGTRSRDGLMREFKKGAFIMALKAGIPIVPISILHSEKIQPPGRYAIRPGKVTLVIHEPIPTRNMTLDDRDRLSQMTRAAIASALPVEKSEG